MVGFTQKRVVSSSVPISRQSIEGAHELVLRRRRQRTRNVPTASPKQCPALQAIATEEKCVELFVGGTSLSSARLELSEPVVDISFDEHGSTLAVATARRVKFYRLNPYSMGLRRAREFRPFRLVDRLIGVESEPRRIHSVTISPDGELAAIGFPNSSDRNPSKQPGYGIVMLVDIKRGKGILDIPVADTPRNISFSDGGDRLTIEVSGHIPRVVRLAE